MTLFSAMSLALHASHAPRLKSLVLLTGPAVDADPPTDTQKLSKDKSSKAAPLKDHEVLLLMMLLIVWRLLQLLRNCRPSPSVNCPR